MLMVHRACKNVVKVARAGMDASAAAVDGVLAGHESPKTDHPNAQWHLIPVSGSHWAFGFVRSW
jgi:hypothetical protein